MYPFSCVLWAIFWSFSLPKTHPKSSHDKFKTASKEIVNELKFPNLSFFGKYFKAHKGMSPKYYRTAYLNTQLSSL